MTGDITRQVFTPETLIDYQSESIVSRLLLKEAGGSVTLFAFDAGQELSEHTTPHDAMVEVVDGKAEIKIDGKPHVVSEGESIVLPANVPHAVRAPERFKMVLTMIRS
jgi:quercetin dioxygenase-like cupin family protein